MGPPRRAPDAAASAAWAVDPRAAETTAARPGCTHNDTEINGVVSPSRFFPGHGDHAMSAGRTNRSAIEKSGAALLTQGGAAGPHGNAAAAWGPIAEGSWVWYWVRAARGSAGQGFMHSGSNFRANQRPCLWLQEYRGDPTMTRLFAAVSMVVLAPLAAAAAPCAPAMLSDCVAARLAAPVRWPRGYVPLDKALEVLARAAQVPVSMVLTSALPNVDLPRRAITPSQFLAILVVTHPGYAWRDISGVLWFYDWRLTADPKNLLNWKLCSFTLGGDPGTATLILRQDLFDLPQQPGAGVALVGLTPRIPGGPLRRRSLHNVTSRQILQALMEAAPTFYSELTYPAKAPLSRRDALRALAAWRFVPLDEPPIPPPPPPGPPIHVPPKPRCSAPCPRPSSVSFGCKTISVHGH